MGIFIEEDGGRMEIILTRIIQDTINEEGEKRRKEEKRVSMDSFVKSKGEKFVEFVFSLFSNLIRFDLIFFRSSFYDSLNWKKNF